MDQTTPGQFSGLSQYFKAWYMVFNQANASILVYIYIGMAVTLVQVAWRSQCFEQ